MRHVLDSFQNNDMQILHAMKCQVSFSPDYFILDDFDLWVWVGLSFGRDWGGGGGGGVTGVWREFSALLLVPLFGTPYIPGGCT